MTLLNSDIVASSPSSFKLSLLLSLAGGFSLQAMQLHLQTDAVFLVLIKAKKGEGQWRWGIDKSGEMMVFTRPI
jgi:hypothetical protein